MKLDNTVYSALMTDLIRDEGKVLKVYDDANGPNPVGKGDIIQGNLTIGIGRNLMGKGISDAEASHLLQNDIQEVNTQLETAFPWFLMLSPNRKRGLINMTFNVGLGKVGPPATGLKGFPKFLAAMAKADYPTAASELKNSAWSKQVGARADRIIALILNG